MEKNKRMRAFLRHAVWYRLDLQFICHTRVSQAVLERFEMRVYSQVLNSPIGKPCQITRFQEGSGHVSGGVTSL